MVRWRAQDPEWRGVNHGGNECSDQKGETMALIGFKCRLETALLYYLTLGKGKFAICCISLASWRSDM